MAHKVVADLKELPIVKSAIKRLNEELPRKLCFHDARHTLEVLEEVIRLALHDKLPNAQMELLAIAAAFHDLGFIKRKNSNEPIAALLVRKAMLQAGYPEEDIKLVETAILDTRLKPFARAKTLAQRCTGKISPHLLDADLSNLGSRSFLHRSLLLFEEYTGTKVSRVEDLQNKEVQKFLHGTLRLMRNHKYHSPAGQALLTSGKKENEKLLQQLLKALNSGDMKILAETWNLLHTQQ